jgi:TonB family protein
MRALVLMSLLVASKAFSQGYDDLAHKIARAAGHPEARVVTLEQERKLTAQPLDETIVWCDTVDGQLACSVEVGAHGEWRSQEFLPNLNGIAGKAVGARWWLPEARTLKPLRVGGDVEPPILVDRTEPEYAPEALKARVGGVVIVEVMVDKNGRVVAAEVLKGLPLGLSEAALEAVKKWRFKPAKLQGSAVDVIYDVTVNFQPS